MIYKKILRSLPAICILSISWYLSSLSSQTTAPVFYGADKLIHFIGFAGLGFFTALICTKTQWQKKALTCFIFCFAAVAVYGAVDELHQSFVPGRDASFFDWSADVFGAAAGIFVYERIINWITKQNFDRLKKDS